ncbi:MAG: peptidylprolyl isomerase [Candidatus Omnitrophota bacterium]|nr:peptidylprolyl isomerase [Candidatus Omnitrophota bacterium]
MLKILRQKHISKIVFWALVILIMPAFVLWGTGNLGGGKSKGPKYAGLVDNKKVTFDEFAQSLNCVKAQILMNYFNQPQALDMFMKDKDLMGRLAWDRILMAGEARKNKIKVTDAEVIKAIKTHPMFVRNGKFDDRLYEYVLRNNLGLYPRNFEEVMRENLTIQKMHDIVAKDIKVADAEALDDYRKNNEKYALVYVIIPAENFMDKSKVEDSEINDYYEKHGSEFLMPAKDPETKQITLKTAELKDVYESVKTRLALDRAKPLATDYAWELREKIVEEMNMDFLSFEDAVSELGFSLEQTKLFSRPDYVEGIGEGSALVDAAFKLKKNEISEVVDARKGAVIFKILEIAPYDAEKFDKEKEEYKNKLINEKRIEVLEGWINSLKKKAKLNIDLSDYEKYYR